MKVDAGKEGVSIAKDRYAIDNNPDSVEICSGIGTPPGDIIFTIPGEDGKDGGLGAPAREMLRITNKGFFVEGRQVPIEDVETHDKEVYQIFKAWLGLAVVRHGD